MATTAAANSNPRSSASSCWRRTPPRQESPPGRPLRKVVTAAQRRAAADYSREAYRVPQQWAGRGRSRPTPRYRPLERPAERPPVRATRRLARKHPRFRCRRIRALPLPGGWRVNVQVRAPPVTGTRFAPAGSPAKAREAGARAREERQQPREPAGRVQERRVDLRLHRGSDWRRETLKWRTLVDENTLEFLAPHVDCTVTGTEM
jgi:hypothetical protein